MSDELRVPKRRARVEVQLSDGAALQLTVFLAEFASGHGGHERLSDLLNAPGDFLPALDAATDAVQFVNRASIAAATVSREWETNDELAGVEEHELELSLLDGAALRGKVRFVLPPGHSRLLDFLNEAQPFIRLEHSDKVTLVNKRHIARIAKVQ
ncbi:MAG TPA: hypothetical protein VLW85_20070 [Myxococcales bacterium]|nr:hypothetical protein [Myxococcales bacterium]